MSEVSETMQPFTMAVTVAAAVAFIISEIEAQLPPAPPPPPPVIPYDGFKLGVLDGSNLLQIADQAGHNLIIPDGCTGVVFPSSDVQYDVGLFAPSADVPLTYSFGQISQSKILANELLTFRPMAGRLLGWVC